MMKVIFACGLLFAIGLHSVVGDFEKEEAVVECLRDLSVDEAWAEHFKKVGELPAEAHADAKCAFSCISKKMTWSDDNGEINKAKILEYIGAKFPHLNKALYEPIIESCAQRSETDHCEKMYEFTKCQVKSYLEYKKKMGGDAK